MVWYKEGEAYCYDDNTSVTSGRIHKKILKVGLKNSLVNIYVISKKTFIIQYFYAGNTTCETCHMSFNVEHERIFFHSIATCINNFI